MLFNLEKKSSIYNIMINQYNKKLNNYIKIILKGIGKGMVNNKLTIP